MPVINSQIAETINITSNGTWDVAKYTSANVDVIPPYCLQYSNNNGVLQKPSTMMDISDSHEIGTGALIYTYSYNLNISGILDWSNITSIKGEKACYSTFYDDRNITSVDLSNLKSITGYQAACSMFYMTTNGTVNLTNIDLSSLEYICGNEVCASMFYHNSATTIDLSNLKIISIANAAAGMFGASYFIQSVDLSSLVLIHGYSNDYYICSSMFGQCDSLSSIDISNLISIGFYMGGNSMFYNCSSLESISFDKLMFISGAGCWQMFSDCYNLKHIYFPSLVANSLGSDDSFNYMLNNVSGCTIHLPTNYDPNSEDPVCDITTLSGYPDFGGYNTVLVFDQTPKTGEINLSILTSLEYERMLYYGFAYHYSITSVDWSGLTSITGSEAAFGIFRGCNSLTSVDFPDLEVLSGNICLGEAFGDCYNLQSVSFGGLKSTSFGSYTNQFNNMLMGCTGVTVHFPSNLQSVIGNWPSTLINFSGDNCTVLFDLPATE